MAGAALGAGTASAATTTVTQADIAHACTFPPPTFCTDPSGTQGTATVAGTPTGNGYLDLNHSVG